jgi:KaiC/GvpD/RAD55 family RecA-like ATPase
MDRLQSYIDGFDDVLGGGIPRGSVVLVCGTPGTMKTSLTFSILYNNVKNNGSKALYISLEEGHEDLKKAMTELGMAGLDDIELYILDVSKIRLEHKEEETSKNWLDILEKYVEQRVKVNKFDLVAIDSMAALYSLSQMHNPRRELFHFFGFLKGLDATTFLVSEMRHGEELFGEFSEDFLADGVLFLKHFDAGVSDVQLRLRCVKMRRARHDKGYYRLLHNEKGFQVTRVISE